MIQRVIDLKWTYLPLLVSFLTIILFIAGLTDGFGISTIISKIDTIDGIIVRAINSANTPFLDSFMYQFSYKWVWVPFYVTILAVLIRNFTWRQLLIISVSIVLTILLADQLCASLLRPAIGRFRPSHSEFANLLHYVNDYHGGNYGFPSCHAANAFAIATLLCFIMRNAKFSIMLTAWVIVMAYSRMYLGVHYPTDLITGSIIGILIGCMLGAVSCRYGGVKPVTEIKWLWFPVAGLSGTCLWIVCRYLIAM